VSSSEFEFNVAEPVPVATGTGFSSDRNFSTRTRTRDQNPCETRGYSRTRAIHYRGLDKFPQINGNRVSVLFSLFIIPYGVDSRLNLIGISSPVRIYN
jgi:hypothetical protein